MLKDLVLPIGSTKRTMHEIHQKYKEKFNSRYYDVFVLKNILRNKATLSLLRWAATGSRTLV